MVLLSRRTLDAMGLGSTLPTASVQSCPSVRNIRFGSPKLRSTTVTNHTSYSCHLFFQYGRARKRQISAMLTVLVAASNSLIAPVTKSKENLFSIGQAFRS